MSRPNIIITGAIGLIGAVILTAFCLFIMAQAWIPALVEQPVYAWGLFLFLTFFSIAEIPVMVFGIRRIAASVNPKAKYVALITIVGYTFFGAVYAAPFILLTGWLALGSALAALCLVRFISVIIYLPQAA
jgi:hypothetical protein